MSFVTKGKNDEITTRDLSHQGIKLSPINVNLVLKGLAKHNRFPCCSKIKPRGVEGYEVVVMFPKVEEE